MWERAAEDEKNEEEDEGEKNEEDKDEEEDRGEKQECEEGRRMDNEQ